MKSLYISLLSQQHEGAAMECRVHCRAALSLISDTKSENKDLPKATYDEDYIFVPSDQSDISEAELEPGV